MSNIRIQVVLHNQLLLFLYICLLPVNFLLLYIFPVCNFN